MYYYYWDYIKLQVISEIVHTLGTGQLMHTAEINGWKGNYVTQCQGSKNTGMSSWVSPAATADAVALGSIPRGCHAPAGSHKLLLLQAKFKIMLSIKRR